MLIRLHRIASQAGVIVAGVCIAVNHALDERRRLREEDREFEAAIAASLYEFEQDTQRRQWQTQTQAQVEREQRAIIASAVARSDTEREGNDGTLRRRRRTSGPASRSTVRVTSSAPVLAWPATSLSSTDFLHRHLRSSAGATRSPSRNN